MATPAVILGMVLVGVVFVQLLLACYGSASALLRNHRQEKMALFLWWERIEIANALRTRRQAKLAWSGHRKFVVDRKEVEADGICSFYLKPRDTKTLPPFQPGQYLTFQLDLPDQPKPIVRCYSLSDAPDSGQYRVTIKRALSPPNASDAPPGLGSNYFHDEVEVGTVLDVQAPKGNFTLDAAERHPAVLIGGGVGITPVLSMLNAAADSDREIWLFYGVRHGQDQIMRDHLRGLCHQFKTLRVVTCYSRPGADEIEGQDFDEKGHLTVETLRKYLPSNNYHYYICGPPAMMKTLPSDLKSWGVPKGDIHSEAFGASSVKARQKPADLATEKGATEKGATEKGATGKATPVAPLQITFSHSGKKLTWDTKFTSLLEFAAEHDIEIESACCAGGCGTCQVAVISGEVVYDQTPDCNIEEGCCLACVGRPHGDLVLDA